jgi:hypothetical protein
MRGAASRSAPQVERRMEFGVAHMAGRSNEQICCFLFLGSEQARLDAFFRDLGV